MGTQIMPSAEIFLPWPDKRLSPNARGHWSSLARAKKVAKQSAYYSALEAGIGKIEADSLSVRYSFFPPSRRRYDLDNLVASMKAAADGIAMAIGVDDSKWTLIIDPRGPVEKNGMVKVELEWAPCAVIEGSAA
jgi:crossover junction endodeoxyribonuclease RusA